MKWCNPVGAAMMLRHNTDKRLHWTTQDLYEVKLYMQSWKYNQFMSGWNPQSIRSMPEYGLSAFLDSLSLMTCTADLQMWMLKFSFFSSHFAHNRCDTVANVLLENKSHVCPYYQLKMGRLSRWALANLSVIFPEMFGTKLHSGKSRMRNIYQSECCDITNDSNLVWWWWK